MESLSVARDRYYLDTNSVIAVLERQRPLSQPQARFLSEIDSGNIDCRSSELALMECLLQPFREAGATRIAAILEFLDDREELPLLNPDRACFIRAAIIRAETGMNLPDSLHVAMAEAGNCTIFVSADRGLRLPSSMRQMEFDQL